jgi:hypothetical protein
MPVAVGNSREEVFGAAARNVQPGSGLLPTLDGIDGLLMDRQTPTQPTAFDVVPDQLVLAVVELQAVQVESRDLGGAELVKVGETNGC